MLRPNLKQLQCLILLVICSTIASIYLFTNLNSTSKEQYKLVTDNNEDNLVTYQIFNYQIKSVQRSSAKVIRSITQGSNESGTSLSAPSVTVIHNKVSTMKNSSSKIVNTPFRIDRRVKHIESVETRTGFLNIHVWNAWCGQSVQRLRFHKHFPLYPDHSFLVNATYSSLSETQYGQRLFGYIHPPVTGKYVFALTSDDDSETWLSTSDRPSDIKNIAAVNYALNYSILKSKNTVFRSSDEIFLKSGQKYYIEILHKQYGFKDYVLLGWKLPGFKTFKRLESYYISTFYDPAKIPRFNQSLYIPITNASFNYHSHYHEFDNEKKKKSFIQRKKFLQRDLIINLFPTCEYNPSYTIRFNLSRYQGIYLVHESAVYPDDGTRLNGSQIAEPCETNREADSHGNTISKILRHTVKPTKESIEKKTFDQSYRSRKLQSWTIIEAWKSKRHHPYNFKRVPKWNDKITDFNKFPLRTRDIPIENKMYGFNWSMLRKDKVYRDETLYKQYITLCRNDGNVLLNDKIAKFVVNYYISALKKTFANNTIQLLKVVNVEENHDMLKGNRYLVELDILKDRQEYRVSDYVYQHQGKVELCRPEGFLWNYNAMVHVIIPVKNQGKWLEHFIHNMDQIYQGTGDDRFNIIIVDFNSSDIKVMDYLRKSSLPNYEVVHMNGSFQRALGLQAGANAVKSKDDIIFMCDLHLQIPETLIENVRKHCLQGRVAYAPIVNRLECGYNPEAPRGSWELLGYGLFGMYKSDFDHVGGMNTNEFKTTWGGEDWELVDRVLQHGLEIERLRLPGFYHHYHSKKKLWENNGK